MLCVFLDYRHPFSLFHDALDLDQYVLIDGEANVLAKDVPEPVLFHEASGSEDVSATSKLTSYFPL